MNVLLRDLVSRFHNRKLSSLGVIPWSSPVPAFGDPSLSRVATLGLNPSNREFVDEFGAELTGKHRRFHTLASLALSQWPEARARHVRLMSHACHEYFRRNPYDGWFRRLDGVLARTGASYYSRSAPACHLDLVPYATVDKWGTLGRSERERLLSAVGDGLARLLRDSAIELVVLNGRSVVQHFESVAGVKLEHREMASWMLRRRNGKGVKGVAYMGRVRHVGALDLRRRVLVVGYNHNIQSSFGVTSEVIGAIRDWVGRVG